MTLTSAEQHLQRVDHVLNTDFVWVGLGHWLVGTFSGNGQTLPDSAFINPVGTRKLLTLSENMNNLSLQSGQVGATKAAKAADLAQTCCVCKEYVGDTVQLECSHAFCVQCVLKVGNEECPACRQAARLGHQQQQVPVTQLRDALQWSWASPRQLW
jgi:hypothetical protein